MDKAQAGQISSRDLIRSKQRVADHGEVFTPTWLVDAMLDLVKSEASRIESRFLESACGVGNFLVHVLQRKLATVEIKFGKSDFDRRANALLALMSTYGIELLADNISECRANMLRLFRDFLMLKESDELYRAASYVLSLNVVQGDSLATLNHADESIVFSEWTYLGKGKFQRQDFRMDALVQSSNPTPFKSYPPMTVRDLARASVGRATRGNV